MDLPVDARVECTDGHGGRSAHVIVDPRRRRVTHLVVEERRRPHIARLVPIELVTRTDPRTIWRHPHERGRVRVRTVSTP